MIQSASSTALVKQIDNSRTAEHHPCNNPDEAINHAVSALETHIIDLLENALNGTDEKKEELRQRVHAIAEDSSVQLLNFLRSLQEHYIHQVAKNKFLAD